MNLCHLPPPFIPLCTVDCLLTVLQSTVETLRPGQYRQGNVGRGPASPASLHTPSPALPPSHLPPPPLLPPVCPLGLPATCNSSTRETQARTRNQNQRTAVGELSDTFVPLPSLLGTFLVLFRRPNVFLLKLSWEHLWHLPMKKFQRFPIFSIDPNTIKDLEATRGKKGIKTTI